MTMMSYAQNGEDVILNRLFPEGTGFFIDIGANDPVDDSVTKLFYDRGWRGINIEPEPRAFARVAAGRPRDINLNVGISEKEGTLTFYDMVKANGWSTFSPDQAANLRAQGFEMVERPIPVTSLAKVCEEHVREHIHFLKIDAESHEVEVMAGADWSRWRPSVVLIEAMSWPHWEGSLLANGYHFALFEGVNRFYVRDEDRHLLPKFATMANFADDFHPYRYMKVIHQLGGSVDELQRQNAELQGRLEAAESQLTASQPWGKNLHNFLRRHPRVLSMVKNRMSRRVG
jgi:FkbM family methyltransferase